MGYFVNKVEVLQESNSNNDYRTLLALAADTWNDGDFLYWDTSANIVKAYKPADYTSHRINQAVIIGIARQGKKVNETKAVVLTKATLLMNLDGTNTTAYVFLGHPMVVKWNASTSSYAVQDATSMSLLYGINAAGVNITEPANAFAVCADDTPEGTFVAGAGPNFGLRLKIAIDGAARINALT